MPRDLTADAREKFEKALFILSQSDTGRYLLTEAKKSGTRLSLMPPGQEDDFLGQASSFSKTIRLSRKRTPEQMALTLAHECAHVIQFRSGLNGGPQGRLPDAVRLMFAAEADALAHMAQVAAELKIGASGGWKSDAPFNDFAKDYPLAGSIADYLMKMEPEALGNGKLMAEVFKTFYQMPHIRVKYESGHVQGCEAEVAQAEKMGMLGDFKKALLFVRKASSEALMDKIAVHKGKPYLKEHGKDVNLSSAQYCGVSSLSKNRLVELLKRVGRAGEAARAEQEIPVLDQMNSAEEQLRLWKDKQKKPGA